MKPHSLLLRLTDPEAFAPDDIGARLPLAFWGGKKWHRAWCTPDGVKAHRMAIVLAWEGKVSRFGCRTTCPLDVTPRAWNTLVFAVLGGDPDGLTELQELANAGEFVLAEHGKEIE